MNLAKHWRQKPAFYRFEGQRHRITGEVRFPSQPPALGEEPNAWEPLVLSGRGEIYSFSMMYSAPEGFEQSVPYPVALIRLEEGILITAQLTDCSEAELFIGQRVEMVTRKLRDMGKDGLLVYGYKFRPCLESQPSSSQG